MAGYGPDCPHCGKSAEWTIGEIQEVVYCPRTYCCNHCYQFYVLDMEEIAKYQESGQELLDSVEPVQGESEEDWKKLREDWDKEESE